MKPLGYGLMSWGREAGDSSAGSERERIHESNDRTAGAETLTAP